MYKLAIGTLVISGVAAIAAAAIYCRKQRWN